MEYTKTLCTQIFNARFKALMKTISNNYPKDLDFKTKIDVVNSTIKSISNRTLIHIFTDFILPNKEITDNMKKYPDDRHIKYWDNIDFNMYKNITNRTSNDQINDENPVFDQIKTIFKISNRDLKKYVISEFYVLKNLAIEYINSSE